MNGLSTVLFKKETTWLSIISLIVRDFKLDQENIAIVEIWAQKLLHNFNISLGFRPVKINVGWKSLNISDNSLVRKIANWSCADPDSLSCARLLTEHFYNQSLMDRELYGKKQK